MRSLLAACLVAAFGCDDFFYVCPAPDSQALEALPQTLSAAGLYRDIAAGEVVAAAREYRPRFELYSDGADKRRWIIVPAGARIDTADVDNWVFPAGTRVFKEFSSAGVRVETRLIEKLAGGGWAAIAYRWRDDGSDADAAPLGAIDSNGTDHDIPAAGECAGCHGGRPSFILGYSAIQLGPDQLDGDLLTAVPEGDLAIPGDTDEAAALGYLHGNCGHCHNAERPARTPCMDPRNSLDFWLRADRLASPEDTPTYQSAIGKQITAGDPDASVLIDRVSTRDLFYRMPPLGSEVVDREGVGTLRRWIEGLEP